MKSDLESIHDFLQQLAEVISASSELEVSFIDSNLKLVAATGILKRESGSYYGSGSLSETLINTGGSYLVENKDTDPRCKGCKRKAKCLYNAAFVSALKIEGKVIGTFGIAATNENQRENLIANQKMLSSFVSKVSDLLVIAMKEKEINKKLLLLTGKYEALVNSIWKGIISIDEAGLVIEANQSALKLLHTPLDKLHGTNINEVFPDLKFRDIDRSQSLELHKKSRSKDDVFVGIITPIKDVERLTGYTICFRAIEDIQSYVGKLAGSESIVTFENIVGNSAEIKRVKKTFEKAAITDSTILIQGESGTGKDIFARSAHGYSLRSYGPFIIINCAAIPEALLESELFGYEEGAFTGARRGGKQGKFELANRGTIFLDEIGEMPLHMQVKMLKVLEQGCVERVGSVQTIPVDIRIIAATHRNLEKMIEQNEFREDLYYRLSVIPILIPPLRDRKEDITLLINYFSAQYAVKLRKKFLGISSEAVAKMLEYKWPGNVRELQNSIEYAISMSPTGFIAVEHLPKRVVQKHIVKCNEDMLEASIKELEVFAINNALKKYGSTNAGKVQAAKHLGISRSSLYRKVREMEEEGVLNP